MRAALAAALPCASGHFAMQYPPLWLDQHGTMFKPGSQNLPGCTGKLAPGEQGPGKEQGCACEWYTNYTFITGKQTIADELRTWAATPNYGPEDQGGPKGPGNHPWLAPGTAPIHSPCGVDGGNPDGCPKGASALKGICKGGGYGNGPDMRTKAYPGNTNPVKWTAGGVGEILWAIEANHGGGYSFRLCKKPTKDKIMTELTEECFQKGHLNFHGDSHWVQTGPDESTRSPPFPALRTTKGTFPPGSMWTRNPIPACTGIAGGFPTSLCTKQQFAPPLPGNKQYPKLYGFGLAPQFKWSIVDKVDVPADLEPGLYVLSIRIDCEQTPQVWNGCSDVLITK